MAGKGALLLDVREQREWDEGHVDGAILFPLSRLRAGKLPGRTLPSGKILYVHCRSGGRARIAAAILRKQGYDARPLRAGFAELARAGFSATT
jgi:rhodanese-related sulfurtransferase